MTKDEKSLVLKFLNQMKCHVAVWGEPDCEDDARRNKEEKETFNKLAKIVGRKGL